MLHSYPIMRQLMTVLVAIAFVFASFGTGRASTHAANLGLACSSTVDSALAVANNIKKKHHVTVSWTTKDNAHLHNNMAGDKSSDSQKSPCCSNYCSASFSLANHSVIALTAIKTDSWPVYFQLLTSAEALVFKRPPRASSAIVVRA